MTQDLTNPSYIAKLLQANGLHTQKQFGQHFLISRSVLDRVVSAANVHQQDTVLEVGVGVGSLTVELAQKANQVVAFEIDQKLRPILAQTLDQHPNITMYFQDALNANLAEILPGPYKLVANLPYNAGSHLLDVLLKSSHQPQSMTVLLQKEVVQKIVAAPPHATYLSNFFQLYGQATLVETIAPSNFFPPPKVDSAIMHAERHSHQSSIDPIIFSRFLHRGFAQPRKMLNKSFEPQILHKANINPADRPERLTFNQWLELFQACNL